MHLLYTCLLHSYSSDTEATRVCFLTLNIGQAPYDDALQHSEMFTPIIALFQTCQP